MKKVAPFFLLIMLSIAFSVQAEDGNMEAEVYIDYEAAYGKVESIDKANGAITLLEHDDEGEELKQKKVTYHISEDIELEGVEGFGDIAPGDWVDLEFHRDEAVKKIADFIAVEKQSVLPGKMDDEEVFEE